MTELQDAEREEIAIQQAAIVLFESQKVAREAVGETIRKITNEIRILNAGSEEEQQIIRERIRLEQELNRLLAAGAEATQLIKVIDAQKELNALKKQQAADKTAQKEEDVLKSQAQRIRDIIKTSKERLLEELKLVAVLERAGQLTADEASRRREQLLEKEPSKGAAGQVEGLTATFRRIQDAAASREPLNVAKATQRGIAMLNGAVAIIKNTIVDARREGQRVAVFGE